jgi:hypothetical protein
MLARVGALEALLRVRLAVTAQVRDRDRSDQQADISETDSRQNGDRWLTPDEAASIANVPRRVVYGWSRRVDWRGFTRRLSRKVLRVEERGFRRWLDRQGSKYALESRR